MEVELIQDEEKGILIVKLSGKLDVFSFAELKGYFDKLYEEQPGARVVCDVSGVGYIASSGWSVLLARRKMAKRDDGELVLSGMDGDIRRVYESMKIQKLLPSYPAVEEAAAALAKGSL